MNGTGRRSAAAYGTEEYNDEAKKLRKGNEHGDFDIGAEAQEET